MHQRFPLDMEYERTEKVDIVYDNSLFTEIIKRELGKKKPKHLLPLVKYIESDLKARHQDKTGITKHITYLQIKKELNKLVLCN